MQILKIAKNFDSRAPLEYLQWIAYNYNIYQSFIHVSIHFHYIHLSASAMAPKQLGNK